jgi:hypothetical protein
MESENQGYRMNAEEITRLYAWADQECADGLANGTLVLRPPGRPTRQDLVLGFLLAISLLRLDPTAARGRQWPDGFSYRTVAQGAGGQSAAAQTAALGEMEKLRRVLVEQWKRVGIQRWSEAAFLGLMGDLADDAAFAADVERSLALVCRELMADPAGPEAALRTAAQSIDPDAMTPSAKAGYRLHRRYDAWLGGGIDDHPI